MTIRPTDDVITSDVTTHTATRCPDGWRVTWLGDRTVDYNLAVTAMMIADTIADPSEFGGELGGDAYVRSLAAELGLTTIDAKRLVTETLPPVVVHQAAVPDAGVVTCGDAGSETFLRDDVTCPACLELNGRPAVHDTHAIPAGDESVPVDMLVLPWQNPILIDKDGDHWQVVAWHADGDLTMPLSRVRRDYGPLNAIWAEQPEPAKTHDLSIRRPFGGTSIAVEGEEDNHSVYLAAGVGLDLGRVLAVLTPAQIALLVDDLIGGAK